MDRRSARSRDLKDSQDRLTAYERERSVAPVERLLGPGKKTVRRRILVADLGQLKDPALVVIDQLV